ncbi:MAG: hypothetical protein IJT77_07000 [Clostridia bacterium]|nr:hypothetical protein [Clostridia bacterium]
MDSMKTEGKAKETANSRDGLDDYIRVSSPGVTITIFAMVLVVAAIIVWGMIGKLPVTATVTGVVLDPYKDYTSTIGMKYEDQIEAAITEGNTNDNILVVCFLDASRFNLEAVEKVGEKVTLEMPDHSKYTGRIEAKANQVPINRAQAHETLFNNDWLTENCIESEYSWPVIIKPNEDLADYEFTLAQVTFITEEVAPISFLVR